MVVIKLGNYHYNLEQCCLYDSHSQARILRQQSLKVLNELACLANSVVSKQALFDKIWKATFVTDDSLTQCIADIRRALEDQQHTILKTIPRRGYLLVAEAVVTPVNTSSNFSEDLVPFIGRTQQLNDLENN